MPAPARIERSLIGYTPGPACTWALAMFDLDDEGAADFPSQMPPEPDRFLPTTSPTALWTLQVAWLRNRTVPTVAKGKKTDVVPDSGGCERRRCGFVSAPTTRPQPRTGWAKPSIKEESRAVVVETPSERPSTRVAVEETEHLPYRRSTVTTDTWPSPSEVRIHRSPTRTISASFPG
jgi:hypothetical protein